MKPHVFKICGTGAKKNKNKNKQTKQTKKKKKKKKKTVLYPLPDRPIENDPDPKYFFIETNRFFLLPKFIFCS